MKDLTTTDVFDRLVDLGCLEIRFRFSYSGSAYFESEYFSLTSGLNKVIRVRVSNHPHPGNYDGICLFRGDKIPEPEPIEMPKYRRTRKNAPGGH